MAYLSGASVAGFPARRWSLSALLRWLHAPIAPVTQISESTATDTAATDNAARVSKRHYPAQRDHVFEQAAMAREMYRL